MAYKLYLRAGVFNVLRNDTFLQEGKMRRCGFSSQQSVSSACQLLPIASLVPGSVPHRGSGSGFHLPEDNNGAQVSLIRSYSQSVHAHSVLTLVSFPTHRIVPLCSREWSHTETDTIMRECKICTGLPLESRWTHGCFNTSGPRAKHWVPLTPPFSFHLCGNTT